MDEWLSLNEAAEKLGVKRVTLYRWSEKGILPIYKMIGKSVVKKADVDKIIADIKPLHKKPDSESEK